MTQVDPDFARLLVLLAEGYPSVRLREGTIRLYAEALKDLTLDQVKFACSRAVKESEFFPTIACLRKMVEPSVDDAAALAWTAFGQAAARVGQYASLAVEDAAAGAALAAVFGSWPSYCALDEREQRERRAEFLVAYRDARRRPWRTDGGVMVMRGLTTGGPGWGWQGRLTAGGAVEVRRVLPSGERAQLDEAPVEEL